MGPRNMVRPAIVVVVCALVLAACSDANNRSSTTTSPSANPNTTSAPDRSEGDPTAAACETDGVIRDVLLGADGIIRPYRIFVPPGRADGGVLPVVLDFHGLGSNGGEQAAYSGYEELAAAEMFIVAHPTGVAGLGGTTSWELSQFDSPGRDDVAFASQFIDLLVDEHCADETRIYTTGFSNGGYFSSQLVCSLAERIAAAVSVAGVTHDDGCVPSRPVPYMAIHGTDDSVVSYDGTGPTLLGPGDPEPGSFFAQIMPDEFAEFAADFRCAAEPVRTEIGEDVVEHRFVECEADVVFYEVIGGGHVWPGSPLAGVLNSVNSRYTSDIDATVDGWAFMKDHSLDD